MTTRAPWRLAIDRLFQNRRASGWHMEDTSLPTVGDVIVWWNKNAMRYEPLRVIERCIDSDAIVVEDWQQVGAR